MWIGLGTKFSDTWMDGNRIEHPGAATNYCASWAIDHRQIISWPEAAVLELWNLPRVRLMRLAGSFRVARRALKGNVVSRVGDCVVVEERPGPAPRRKATKRLVALPFRLLDLVPLAPEPFVAISGPTPPWAIQPPRASPAPSSSRTGWAPPRRQLPPPPP